MYLVLYIQGVFWQSTSAIRNCSVTGLFWNFWGSLRHLCDPKTGHKLLISQKYTLGGIKTCEIAVCQIEEFHGQVFWAWNTENWVMTQKSNLYTLWFQIHAFKFLTMEDFKKVMFQSLWYFKFNILEEEMNFESPWISSSKHQTMKFFFLTNSFLTLWLVLNLTKEYFWPKRNLRPVLGSHISL